MLANGVGHAIETLGQAARDRGEGIAVAADRDGVADGLLESLGLQEGDDGLGHGPLAGHVELIIGSDGVEREVQVVIGRERGTDLGKGGPAARQENALGRRHRPLDPLGMIVRHPCENMWKNGLDAFLQNVRRGGAGFLSLQSLKNRTLPLAASTRQRIPSGSVAIGKSCPVRIPARTGFPRPEKKSRIRAFTP